MSAFLNTHFYLTRATPSAPLSFTYGAL